MQLEDLLRRIRRIEIKTKRLSSNIFAGEYHTAFKGRGMVFSEVREYREGDEIRDIDWNVTARYSRPFVKVFEEERELTLMLMVDVSNSGLFGTHGRTKRELIAEVAATLAFSSIQNNDKVGVLFFSDRIEKFIPPGKGRKHVLHILSEILTLKPEGKGTNIEHALSYIRNMMKKQCSVFLLSDLIDENPYETALSLIARKHDLRVIRVYDRHEADLPDVGLVRVEDAETGKMRTIDTSNRKTRESFARRWKEQTIGIETMLNKYDIGHVTMLTDADYVPGLLQLFAKR
ncbi:DUF58 domain-containing protein [Porphyromonas sp. COT-108 OH1349]|uniref:DUF58 domain-containing protein n=1 Tax=Porphyromonas sp. COT-108 OH1349 TaxID=1537504 RepID=UPI00052C98F1|nr:DUF58 domain-containing protein [Porphyromonas sp. COT-108 OH1349]KGN70534.1 hypothetical protein JT26_03480 [Porphyromonas sp. COT-108 OH1349]